MRVVGGDDVDDVDVTALDNRPPIGVCLREAEVAGGGRRQFVGHFDNHLTAQLHRELEGDGCHGVREAVRPAHEASANQGDPQFAHVFQRSISSVDV